MEPKDCEQRLSSPCITVVNFHALIFSGLVSLPDDLGYVVEPGNMGAAKDAQGSDFCFFPQRWSISWYSNIYVFV